MSKITKATQLYNFLWYCNEVSSTGRVLDCGAAGRKPPLEIFLDKGYEVYGIDINQDRILMTQDYERTNNINLNIREGDMRSIDFEDGFFDFLYSYNSIFHLCKDDSTNAVREFRRVTRKGGLIFVNFLSVDDCMYGDGIALGNGEFQQDEDGDTTVHSFYGDCEADGLFQGCTIIHKEKRILEHYINGEKYRQAFIDYIVRNDAFDD